MAIRRYLAMTAAEIRANPAYSGEIAWMACHFSPYSTGISNLPPDLPAGSLLILNDIMPIHGHDPALIARQLRERLEDLDCHGLLLDFQRPGSEETAALAAVLTEELPCPVAVSHHYAAGLPCPVFLPPVPPDTSLRNHLAPWQGREIWLELALENQVITLSETGAESVTLPWEPLPEDAFHEESLHCRYRIRLSGDRAVFTLSRGADDLQALLQKAETAGVATAVGLYQQLRFFAL